MARSTSPDGLLSSWQRTVGGATYAVIGEPSGIVCTVVRTSATHRDRSDNVGSIARILDANANRAREALRVMQDYARFVLDDPSLTRDLKQIRHELRDVLDLLGPGRLEASRDTGGDVGTRVTAAREYDRTTAAEVVIANGKRLSEALRTLEEFAKIEWPRLPTDIGAADAASSAGSPSSAPAAAVVAARIEALRYRGYIIEQRLQMRMRATAGIEYWAAGRCGFVLDVARHPLIDASSARDRLHRRLIADLPAEGASSVARGGRLVDAVLFWFPGDLSPIAATDRLSDLASALLDTVRRCRQAGIAVLVAGRLDDAMILSADALLLSDPTGATSSRSIWSPAAMRTVVGRAMPIGSVLSPAEARKLLPINVNGDHGTSETTLGGHGNRTRQETPLPDFLAIDLRSATGAGGSGEQPAMELIHDLADLVERGRQAAGCPVIALVDDGPPGERLGESEETLPCPVLQVLSPDDDPKN
ncbi:MAG: hypothetical protein ACOC0P_02240 [Planctomycetota bacterium]